MSKTRIAPIKDTKKNVQDLTNPETELMSAYIGSTIAETIIKATEAMKINLEVFMWGDNQVVLFWISKSEGHLRLFIKNRAKKIQDFNKARNAVWGYVSTQHNPADILPPKECKMCVNVQCDHTSTGININWMGV